MFGLKELIGLILSAFFILPTVVILRELGYVLAGKLVGAKNARITLGSGTRVFKWKMFDFRRHYQLYSWYSYDELSNQKKWAYVFLYSAPILINIIFGLVINALIANEFIDTYETFWNRFVFYAFYYVLFDALPMRTVNGKPNNGRIIFDMVKHGKRTDLNKERFIPATTEVEDAYQKEMAEIEKMLTENDVDKQ
ncbi:hypothetical protein HMI01_26620 [Halolactibacillus miurensis]|uniref:Uncharacterized protein n=1 Tax=Halolactibacillus miurensis TaxID=306541 RepID=A0A1I6UC72_9BACI|nr:MULTISPECIES: hypothetical protein [Halolactibacillus]GEM05674.1 hypothetical protein HMI01_26620 [Halolactibacillus miurensis]SFS98988.1 hypothetical protein SAMN05421668_12438 [Halolactibacillus miurensis]